MLAKKNRLKSNKILQVIKKGKLFSSKSFNLRWLEKEKNGVDFAIVIPTRLDKKAVKRNRAKRLFRESIRQFLPQIKFKGEIVVLGKKDSLNISFLGLLKEIGECFRKLNIKK